MAKYIAPGKLMIKDENLDIHPKMDLVLPNNERENRRITFEGIKRTCKPGKIVLDATSEAVLNGKTKNSKADGKKDGLGLAGRKALNDITNKTFLLPEASSRKNNLPKEEFNVKDEMFLHDHKKCIEAQKAAMNTFNLELVLPGHDSMSILEQTKVPHSPQCYPEPVELSMSKFSDWLDSSTHWSSPPSSPSLWDSPPSSPFAWQDEAFEFVLKEEIDAQT